MSKPETNPQRGRSLDNTSKIGNPCGPREPPYGRDRKHQDRKYVLPLVFFLSLAAWETKTCSSMRGKMSHPPPSFGMGELPSSSLFSSQPEEEGLPKAERDPRPRSTIQRTCPAAFDSVDCRRAAVKLTVRARLPFDSVSTKYA